MRSIIIAPCSSNSCLLIHICWKDPSELRIEPPIHGVNLFSAAEIALMRTYWGATAGIYACNLSKKPLKHVLPPVTIMLENMSLLMSMSVLAIDSTTMFWTPVNPSTVSAWLNIGSSKLCFSEPIEQVVPSGS